MGKSIALAMPFIIALILFVIWIAYRAGKRTGQNEAPQRANVVHTKLLHEADRIFSDLMYVDDVQNDDILTQRTRKVVNTWRNDYMKAKNS